MTDELVKCKCGGMRMLYESRRSICNSCGATFKFSESVQSLLEKQFPQLVVISEVEHSERTYRKRNRAKPRPGQKTLFDEESTIAPED